jgi:hypothetical protein
MPKGKRFVYLISFFSLILTVFSTFTLSGVEKGNIINIAITGLCSLFCLFYILKYGSIKWNSLFVLEFIFLLSILVSFFLNGLVDFQYTPLLLAIVSGCFFEFASQSKFEREIVLRAFFFGSIGFIFSFLIVYFGAIIHPSISSSNRLGTIFNNQNEVGRFLVFCFIICFYFALFKKYIFSYLFVFLSVYFVLLTGSISNLLCIFCIIFFSVFLFFGRKGRLVIVLSFVFSLVLFFGILQIPVFLYFKTRIYGALQINGQSDLSTFERWNAAVSGFYLFLEKPLFGWGANYVSTSDVYSIYSHNNIAEVAACFGIFGLLSEETLFIKPFIHSLKKKNYSTDRLFMFSAMIAFFMIIFQFFLVSYYSKIEFYYLSLMYSSMPTEVIDMPKLDHVFSKKGVAEVSSITIKI